MPHNRQVNELRNNLDPTQQQRVAAARERLRKIAYWLEGCIPVPGTRWTVGLEPIIGMVPIAGDALGFAVSSLIIFEGIKLGAPPKLIGRMIGVTALDTVVGLVPLLGDVFDFAYKANKRNAALLLRHLDEVEGKPVRKSWQQRVVGVALLGGLIVLVGWAAYGAYRLVTAS